MAVSSTSFGQGNTAAQKHGLESAFARTGDETALTEPQLSRLAVLRADLSTPEGIVGAMRERAARMVLIAEWGEEFLRDKAEREGSISAFESKMLQRFFTAQAEARRALESLARMQGKDDGLSAADVLESLRAGKNDKDK